MLSIVSRKGGAGRQRSRSRGTQRASTPTARTTDEDIDRDTSLTDYPEQTWERSRSGANAGRGFHFQDAVGAWLLLKAQVGEVSFDRLVPEGLEDLSCEGPAGWQVQVKSRQARVGDFPRRLAARYVVDAWARYRPLATNGRPERLAIVFERPVHGEASRTWGVALSSSPDWVELSKEIRRVAAAAGFSDDDIQALLADTSLFVLSHSVINATAVSVPGFDLTGTPALAPVVVRALRAAIADRADANAAATWETRHGISKTDVIRLVREVVELVDRIALEEALRSGACVPVDFDTPMTSDAFYEGESTQPGHVAAGLVVGRPRVTDAVLAALDNRKAVLVAGPSGIGKSAIVWMAAYAARHAQWFRIIRLRDADVEPLIRLARAYGAGGYAPVGFVVDAVGTGSIHSWDALREAAANQPGLLLLGSVREEDILPLRSVQDCAVIRPRLDEEVASRIHAELFRRGATAQSHWREAYDGSNGLTLEYTHLLTRGERLGEVIRQQVNDRVRERRDMELSLLAPISFAHQSGASIDLDLLKQDLTLADAPLKATLSRLVQEHLVAIDGVVVSGLHPIRSGAICDAIHLVPPPSLAATAQTVVRSSLAVDLQTFLGETLVDHPELAVPILDAIIERVSSTGIAVAALRGLRLADFITSARRWRAIVQAIGVPVPMIPTTFQVALAGADIGDLEQAFDSRVADAIRSIRADTRLQISPLRDALVERLGVDDLSRRLTTSASFDEVLDLLAVLAGTGLELNLEQPSPCSDVVQRTSLDQLAELMQAASGVSHELGQLVLMVAGGVPSVLRRLREADPYLLDIELVSDGSELVLSGARLHVSDRLNPDVERSIKRLAMLGLGCLTGVDRAALSTVWPGRIPMAVGGHRFGFSGLLRKYVHGASEIDWNQTRSRAAITLVATDSETRRLAAAVDLLVRVEAFVDDLTRDWILNRGDGRRLQVTNERRANLIADIENLAPSGTSDAFGADPIHSFAQGVVQNVATRLASGADYSALAAFVGGTLIGQSRRIEGEPWHLVDLDGPPPSIARIRQCLVDLHAVLAELAWGDESLAVGPVARSGSSRIALSRVAQAARRQATARHEKRVATIVANATGRGLRLNAAIADDNEAAETTWPRVRTLFVVEIHSLTELEDARSALISLFAETLPSATVVTLVPAHAGKTIQTLATKVFVSGGSYPMPDEMQAWEDVAPPPLSTPLANAVLHAFAALQELSGLAYLTRERSGASIDDAADEARASFNAALLGIQAMPADAVTELIQVTLLHAADRVREELDANPSGPSYAEAVIRGAALDEDNEETRVVNVLAFIATEWDCDPESATRLIA